MPALRVHRLDRRPPPGRLQYRIGRASLVVAQPRTYIPIVAGTVGGMVVSWIGLSTVALVVLTVGWVAGLVRVALAACSRTYAERVIPDPGPPFDPVVVPCDVHHEPIRDTYELILEAHERIRKYLAHGDRLSDRLATLYDFSGELVNSAGRIAIAANAIGDYLDRADGTVASVASKRLDRCALVVDDDQASDLYRAAATARRREVDHHRQLQGICDRIQARLEVVLAALGNVMAMAVKIRAMDGEQLARAGSSLVEQLVSLDEDERIVEAAMREAADELMPSSGGRRRIMSCSPSSSPPSSGRLEAVDEPPSAGAPLQLVATTTETTPEDPPARLSTDTVADAMRGDVLGKATYQARYER